MKKLYKNFKTLQNVGYIYVAMFFLLFINISKAQGQYKLYAGFIYHFSKYVQWPEQSGDLVVGVLGNSPINTELAAIDGKMAGNRKVIIKNLKSMSDVGSCQIVFIPQSMSADIADLYSKTKGKNILIVSETDNGAKKGAIINFIQDGGKVRFELNMKAAADNGLKISADLQKVAIMV